MNFWIITALLNFVLCVFLAGIVIPQILLIANRKNLYDIPNERKIHNYAIPRLGGIAFKPVILFSTTLIMGISYSFGNDKILQLASNEISQLLFGYCAIMVLYLIGMADDLIGLRYRVKFVSQILCAIMLIAGGIFISNFEGIIGIKDIPVFISYPFTGLLVLFIINAINLIDGIDGLASGLSSVALLFYGVTFYKFNHYIYGILSFGTLGVLLPFFYYNVFGSAKQGKKIFMGDTGSLTIGIILSFLSIRLAQFASTNNSNIGNPIVLAFAPLLIPCFDVIRVYVHRIRIGNNPFLPDKNHIHHKLLALGMNQRKAMISILIFSVFLTIINICLSRHINVNWIIFGNIVLLILINSWLTKRIKN